MNADALTWRAKQGTGWGAMALLCAAARAQTRRRRWPLAAGPSGAQQVEVTGHHINSLGSNDAASAGTITRQLVEDRPLLRPGNLLETIPGLVVTQHSGSGKANQYFLRGFNLDHGTDFATWEAGMPVNLRTHAHGQGYTDLNFVIPELISRVDYWKVPYYAEIGDFGSAGGAKMHCSDRLKQGLALGTLGDYGYRRALLAGSPELGPGIFTYALEHEHDDGPWDVPMNFRKWNGLLRWTLPLGEGKFGLTAMGYSGEWDAIDQIARRALDDGTIGRFFGTLDASTGGTSSRYSLSADFATPLAGGKEHGHWFKYRLNLYSNFTYFLSDPAHGDQFEQADNRNVFGWTGQWTRSAELFDYPSRNILGYELRQDRIRPLGLYATRERRRLSSTREDHVVEGSAGLFVSNETQWSDRFRSVLGLRYDRYCFDVDALSTPQNSGNATSGITSPKMSLIFGPWDKTEYFVNAGYGFHSNDGRGVTIEVDPVTGAPADAATPLVRSKGAQLGLRTEAVPNVQSSLALWYLKLDSELVFVGDAGATEAGRPSRRYGVEWSTRWRAKPWMFLDLDIAWNHARFTGNASKATTSPARRTRWSRLAWRWIVTSPGRVRCSCATSAPMR